MKSRLPVVIEADLAFKHQQMAAAVFPFLRATFYRWAERWVERCPHLATAPVVLGIGDIHVENYGTWRDAEGRLIWGVNDFDEATHIPYTADLVRLATSAGLATGDNHLSVRPKDAADALLAGYQEALGRGGKPFVLAEHHRELRTLASGELRDPVRFWDKMQELPEAAVKDYPADAVTIVAAALPGPATAAKSPSIRSRRAGLGSLGRPRLVALADCLGGAVAREVKAMLPSAWDWAVAGETGPNHYAEIVDRAVRAADPGLQINGDWLVRRLAPDCARIELGDLPAERDEELLLRAMGYELANIHLGTANAGPDILADLSHQPSGWLVKAAAQMTDDTEADWNAWQAVAGQGATESCDNLR